MINSFKKKKVSKIDKYLLLLKKCNGHKIIKDATTKSLSNGSITTSFFFLKCNIQSYSSI